MKHRRIFTALPFLFLLTPLFAVAQTDERTIVRYTASTAPDGSIDHYRFKDRILSFFVTPRWASIEAEDGSNILLRNRQNPEIEMEIRFLPAPPLPEKEEEALALYKKLLEENLKHLAVRRNRNDSRYQVKGASFMQTYWLCRANAEKKSISDWCNFFFLPPYVYTVRLSAPPGVGIPDCLKDYEKLLTTFQVLPPAPAAAPTGEETTADSPPTSESKPATTPSEVPAAAPSEPKTAE